MYIIVNTPHKGDKDNNNNNNNSEEQSNSWEANRFSDIKKLATFYGNLFIHYRTYNSPSPAPVLSMILPVHPPTPQPQTNLLKIHFQDLEKTVTFIRDRQVKVTSVT